MTASRTSNAPIRFYPIDMGFPEPVQPDGGVTARCDGLGTFLWFDLWQQPDRILQIHFPNDCIIRILDDMAISTESEPARWQGLVADHFAYRVEGDPFETQQSEMWRTINDRAVHYRFHTGESCLNVMSISPPRFTLIPKAKAPV
jgi:hypothetical protein